MTIFGGQRSGLMRGLACCLLILGLLLPESGCGDSGGNRRARANRAPGSAITPSDLVGRWLLQFVQMPVEIDFAIVDISHKDGKYTLKLLGIDDHPAHPVLKTYSVKDDGQVRMELEMGGVDSSFQGRLDGENIWGTLMAPQFHILPAKMSPTELTEVDFKKEPERIAALGDLMAAQNSADHFVALDEFVKKKETYRSPILIDGYAALANFLKSEKFSLEKVKEFIAEYRQAIEVWGPRMAPRVDLEVGKALAAQEIYPDLAKELLAQAEKQITADYPVEWKMQLAESWINVGDYERGLKVLKPLQEQDGTNPMIRLIYARAKDHAKDVDEALKTYAGLAMLPQLEQSLASRGAPADVLPSESAARLWKKKHGDTKGLDDYLKTAYEEQMKMFVPEHKSSPRDASGQVVLLELFTGAACNPCVPADIACEALRVAFSPQELVVIKYHQHSPLPDPLANEPGIGRFAAYAGEGTPALMVNGHQLPNVGGYVGQTAHQVALLKAGIEEDLKKTSPVEIKLSATRKGDDIEIKASVTGIKTTDNDPRLVLVLLENGIKYRAPNGIRIHNAIARGFAGGIQGIKLRPGEVDHTAKISLPKLKEELAEHLKMVEEQVGKQFPVKPLELANLQVAAIVQNQITKTHIQSALVDVVEAQP